MKRQSILFAAALASAMIVGGCSDNKDDTSTNNARTSSGTMRGSGYGTTGYGSTGYGTTGYGTTGYGTTGYGTSGASGNYRNSGTGAYDRSGSYYSPGAGDTMNST